MKLTENERLSLSALLYTDHTYSHHIKPSDVRSFKSLVRKGLVTVEPDRSVFLVKLTDAGKHELGI